MSMSRILGILALIGTAASAGAGLLGVVKPQYAMLLTGIAAAITAFTERVQGGVSVQK